MLTILRTHTHIFAIFKTVCYFVAIMALNFGVLFGIKRKLYSNEQIIVTSWLLGHQTYAYSLFPSCVSIVIIIKLTCSLKSPLHFYPASSLFLGRFSLSVRVFYVLDLCYSISLFQFPRLVRTASSLAWDYI